MSGLVLRAYRARRVIVSDDSFSNVGRMWKISRSRSSRDAVVENTRSLLRISAVSWPSRSLSASNTVPELRTSWRTAPSWEFRTISRRLASCANGARLPIASERSRPRPLSAWAWVCIHSWNASRVFSSKARKISSSSTVGDTWEAGSVPFSANVPLALLPGVSST